MVDKVLLQLCYTIFHLSFNAVPSYAFPSAIKYQTYVGALNFKTVLSKAFQITVFLLQKISWSYC